MNALWATRTDIPQIDMVRIQAEVYVPLIRALRSEMDEQHLKEFLNRTLMPMFREVGRRYFKNADCSALDAMQAHAMASAAGDSETIEMRQNGDMLEVDVTRCQYAQFFRDLGEPEIGFLLVCSSDYGIFEEIQGVEMTRSQTIMQGEPCCDFRFRFTTKTDVTR